MPSEGKLAPPAPRSMISWGAFAPDSREAMLMAVAPGVMIPKLYVPWAVT